ncbi:MAG: nitrous oxide reductase family maturation protein NosD [Candidatus Omnitrophota bacterium]|nr:nitrous oxide reductase family maturation protein NosD [Candidatus Omnitrophota bacterium]
MARETTPSAVPPTRGRRVLGPVCLGFSAALLLCSARLPYWYTHVSAPQYPNGLTVVVYPNRITGDVREIDSLNHYIGMRPLEQGAPLERRLAIPGLIIAALALLAAAVVPVRWAGWLILPALLLPLLFAGDLYWWLREYGLHLNPKAPLNHSVKPFIPALLGEGKIAQFHATAWFGIGFYLALAAGVLAAFGVWTRRHAVRAITKRALALATSLLLCGGTAEAKTMIVTQEPASLTIHEALAAAAPGDTIVVRGGIHRGAVRVTTPVTLVGEAGAVLEGGGVGTVVTIDAPGTLVRGFTIRGSGNVLSRDDAGLVIAAARVTVEGNRFEEVLFGVSLHHAPGSIVRGNTLRSQPLPVARRGDLIRVWYSDDVTIADNDIDGGRDLVLWFSQRIRVTGNRVRRSRYGLHFMYCNDAAVEANTLTDNSVGIYLMYSTRLRLLGNRMVRNRGPSGYGLGLKDMEETTVTDNLLAENRVGVFLEHASGVWSGNVIAANDVGLQVFPTAQANVLTGNSLIDNGEQVIVQGSGDASRNRWRGNYWSDYRGFDADGDGQGDVPYRAERLFERLIDRYPAFRLFAGSPAAQAIDLAARTFPLFAPRPLLVDDAPRMQPVMPAGLGRTGGRVP